jgi:hypothetical protein
MQHFSGVFSKRKMVILIAGAKVEKGQSFIFPDEKNEEKK